MFSEQSDQTSHSPLATEHWPLKNIFNLNNIFRRVSAPIRSWLQSVLRPFRPCIRFRINPPPVPLQFSSVQNAMVGRQRRPVVNVLPFLFKLLAVLRLFLSAFSAMAFSAVPITMWKSLCSSICSNTQSEIAAAKNISENHILFILHPFSELKRFCRSRQLSAAGYPLLFIFVLQNQLNLARQNFYPCRSIRSRACRQSLWQRGLKPRLLSASSGLA